MGKGGGERGATEDEKDTYMGIFLIFRGWKWGGGVGKGPSGSQQPKHDAFLVWRMGGEG